MQLKAHNKTTAQQTTHTNMGNTQKSKLNQIKRTKTRKTLKCKLQPKQ